MTGTAHPIPVNWQTHEPLDLRYFVQWHTWLWVPAVRALLADSRRFAGKRVLELGCGEGKMSCLFALLGARVTALEMPHQSLDAANAEVRKWRLKDQVSLRHYDGDLKQVPGAEFDFVFSKSVLVIVPDLLSFSKDVATVLRPDGRLLAAENLQRGTALRKLRDRAIDMTAGRFRKDYYARFRGVTPVFLDTLRQTFDIVSYRESYGLVAAIEGKKK